MLARLAPQNDEERAAIQAAHQDAKRVYTAADMVAGDEIFFAATGITDGMLLEGVAYQGNRATTHSLVIRGKSGVRRLIQTDHPLMEGGRHRVSLRNSVSLRSPPVIQPATPSTRSAVHLLQQPGHDFFRRDALLRWPETRGHPAAAYPAESPWRPWLSFSSLLSPPKVAAAVPIICWKSGAKTGLPRRSASHSWGSTCASGWMAGRASTGASRSPHSGCRSEDAPIRMSNSPSSVIHCPNPGW